ncbi:MAG: class II fructose-bisphosphate aldolase [Candidatus Woesearchaeota archaeon]
MLVSSKELLNSAKAKKIAIGAFNINNYEFAKGIILAAQEMKQDVIVQTTQHAIDYASFKVLSSIVKSLAEDYDVKIVLHLDHGKDIKYVINAIKYGWTSVMIDGSDLPYEQNVALTKAVVKIAHQAEIPVEGELGPIPKATEKITKFTDPDQVEDFVNSTDVDFLAVAIGNAHGIYSDPNPKINLDVLKKINKKVNIPLVMHGGSGLPDEQIKQAIQNGISKINFDTELRIAFSNALENYFKKEPGSYNVRTFLTESINSVKEKVKEKMKILN